MAGTPVNLSATASLLETLGEALARQRRDFRVEFQQDLDRVTADLDRDITALRLHIDTLRGQVDVLVRTVAPGRSLTAGGV